MCESDTKTPLLVPQPLPPAPSTPPNSQIHSISPESSTHCTPKLAKRMQGDTCFRCHQQGHWSYYCPLISPNNTNNRSVSPIKTPSPGNPMIYCRCGHGFCEIRTATNERNKGKRYYVCPIKRGMKCAGFVKWCDDGIDQSYHHPPPFKYPECECGAGVCRRVKEAGKYSFVCPFVEGHGACSYHISEDELLRNKSIVPVRKTKFSQRTLPGFCESYPNGKSKNDLSYRGDLLTEHSKRMRIMENSEQPSLNAREHDETKSSPVSSKRVGFPEFEVVDDLYDPDIVNSVPWDAVVEEALSTPGRIQSPQSVFRLENFADDLDIANSLPSDDIEEEPPSTPARIPSQQAVFQRRISAAADASFVAGTGPMRNAFDARAVPFPTVNSFGPVAVSCPVGWLGRLLFFHPLQSLKFPPSQPFLCCIFPSFNAIVIPKQESIHDGPCGESNQLAVSNLSQHFQHSTECHSKVSMGVVSSPNKSPGSERRPMSKEQRQKQMAFIAQQQLLNDLESLDPHDHESMREAAEATFAILDSLRVDCKQFSDHVWDFISSASLLAEIERSMEKFPSPEECNQLREVEKVRHAKIQEEYGVTKALLEASKQRSESLHEEESRLKAMLSVVQSQLTSCESETMKIESHLCEINKNMLEADTALKVIAEQAEMARKLNEEKEGKQNAAKIALGNAKLELEK